MDEVEEMVGKLWARWSEARHGGERAGDAMKKKCDLNHDSPVQRLGGHAKEDYVGAVD